MSLGAGFSLIWGWDVTAECLESNRLLTLGRKKAAPME